MSPNTISVSALLVLTSIVATTQTHAETPTLSLGCEIALARSALPVTMRKTASVFAYDGTAFVETVSGDGPFTCIVGRNHARSIVPQCMDREGRGKILPKIIKNSLMALAGKSANEIDAAYQADLAAGKVLAPARAGVSYMASDYNHIYFEAGDQIQKVPPHLMFYAPGVTNADIDGAGPDADSFKGRPFIIEPGPHGYMISFVDQPADTSEVKTACAHELDWLWQD